VNSNATIGKNISTMMGFGVDWRAMLRTNSVSNMNPMVIAKACEADRGVRRCRLNSRSVSMETLVKKHPSEFTERKITAIIEH